MCKSHGVLAWSWITLQLINGEQFLVTANNLIYLWMNLLCIERSVKKESVVANMMDGVQGGEDTVCSGRSRYQD